MDQNECDHLLSLSRNVQGMPKEEFVRRYAEAVARFNAAAAEHFQA